VKKYRIAILGGGNLGTSLAKGLIASGQFNTNDIIITEKSESRIAFLKNMGFKVTSDNFLAVTNSTILVMSVKPQQFDSLTEEVKGAVTSSHILLSTITGVNLLDLENALREKIPVFRIMPNTALEICQSMTCISSKNASEEVISTIIEMFDKLGKTLTIPEEIHVID